MTPIAACLVASEWGHTLKVEMGKVDGQDQLPRNGGHVMILLPTSQGLIDHTIKPTDMFHTVLNRPTAHMAWHQTVPRNLSSAQSPVTETVEQLCCEVLV